MALPKHVKLVEVSPRDGLQNEIVNIPTDIKVHFINALSATGLRVIESTSFVSPTWIKQLADHNEVLLNIKRHRNIRYPALVPNLKGLGNALTCKVKDIAVFTAASETFNQRNINCSIEVSLQRIQAVIDKAKKHKVRVRGYISCVIGCPYEGDIKPDIVAKIADKLFAMGCYEVSLGDTIGVGTPQKAQQLIQCVANQVPLEHLAIHFHDTYGQALANIYACLESGIGTIDASVAGLGGCPYAPGASGNVATEDVLYLLNGLNIETGVDLRKLIEASKVILNFLQRPTQSKVAKALGY